MSQPSPTLPIRSTLEVPPLLCVYYEATDQVVIIGPGGFTVVSLSRQECLRVLAMARAEPHPSSEGVSMPLLNYTTTVAVERSVEIIQRYLAAHGATAILIEYARGEVQAISFKMCLDSIEVPYRLPANWHGVLAALRADRRVPPRARTEAQAKRVAWRIVKDWLEAQLAVIESRQVSFAQVMLPYAVLPDGQTVYERWKATPLALGVVQKVHDGQG